MSDSISRAYTEDERRRIAQEWYPFDATENFIMTDWNASGTRPMSQPTSPWIDVRDRLPDMLKTVLVQADPGYGEVVTVKATRCNGGFETGEGYFIPYDDAQRWRPL